VHLQAPPAHLDPPVQTTPHLPQFCSSVLRLVQIAPHASRPPGQTQAPSSHELPALQTLPQTPQLVLLVERSMQVAPQSVWPELHAQTAP
jgi:hypothetical protein